MPNAHCAKGQIQLVIDDNKSAGRLDLKIIACTILKVLCVPKSVSRRILGVPEHEEIEGAYAALGSAAARPVESLEMQPAF